MTKVCQPEVCRTNIIHMLNPGYKMVYPRKNCIRYGLWSWNSGSIPEHLLGKSIVKSRVC